MSKLITNKQSYAHNIIRKNEPNVFLPFPYYCRSLVLAVPIDTSGETSSVQAGDAERASVWWVLLVLDKLNLGSYNPCTQNSANKWFCCWDRDFVIKGMFWRPTKKEISEWLERKE
jgi:hypothetical protein